MTVGMVTCNIIKGVIKDWVAGGEGHCSVVAMRVVALAFTVEDSLEVKTVVVLVLAVDCIFS